MISCTLHEMNDGKNWIEILPTVELAVHSTPKGSTGFSTLFLDFGYHLTMPADSLTGDKYAQQEVVGQSCE